MWGRERDWIFFFPIEQDCAREAVPTRASPARHPPDCAVLCLARCRLPARPAAAPCTPTAALFRARARTQPGAHSSRRNNGSEGMTLSTECVWCVCLGRMPRTKIFFSSFTTTTKRRRLRSAITARASSLPHEHLARPARRSTADATPRAAGWLAVCVGLCSVVHPTALGPPQTHAQSVRPTFRMPSSRSRGAPAVLVTGRGERERARTAGAREERAAGEREGGRSGVPGRGQRRAKGRR